MNPSTRKHAEASETGGRGEALSGQRKKCARLSFMLVITCAIGFSPWCLLGDQVVADGVIWTSIIRLLAHPSQYEGKKVQVMGYYATGQELRSLFLTKEDARAGNAQSAIWLDLGSAATNNLVDKGLKSGPAMVVGTFHADPKQGTGHMGTWPGELRNITFLQKRK